MYRARPIVAFATIGQGRADGKITPEEESTVLGKLLTHWALTSTLEAAAGCAAPQPPGDPFQRGIERDEPTFNHDEENTMAELEKTRPSGICGFVTIADRKGVVANAEVCLHSEQTIQRKGRARRPSGEPLQRTRTDDDRALSIPLRTRRLLRVLRSVRANRFEGSVRVAATRNRRSPRPRIGPLFRAGALRLRRGTPTPSGVSRRRRPAPDRSLRGARATTRSQRSNGSRRPTALATESEREVELVFREAGKATVEAIVLPQLGRG